MMRAWIVAASLAVSVLGASADEFAAPRLTGPIVDEVGVIARDRYAELDAELRALSDSGRAQVAVLVTRSLGGLDIADYGIRLAEAWKIGTKSKGNLDRGAIFIVAPNERRMRIEVGYGLEGEIPDAVASRILERIVKPRFRANRMSDGIVEGTRALIALARGEAEGAAEAEPAAGRRLAGPDSPPGTLWAGTFVVLLVLFGIGLFRKLPFALGAGLFVGSHFFSSFLAGAGIAFALYALSRIFFRDGFFRRHRRRGFGGWDDGPGGWGGGGFTGGFSGGFSGGGGSFGGGGASSDW